MQNPFIIGDKIYLRPLDMEDVDSFVSWLSDTEIRKYLGITSPMNKLGEEKYIKELYRDEKNINLGIMLKDGDEFIGSVGLHDFSIVHRNAEIGIVIGKKNYWSKGHGTEALRLMMGYGFGQLNLHKIYLRVMEYNPRAIRAYEKVGFKTEAVFRKHVYADGEYYDDIYMAVLKD